MSNACIQREGKRYFLAVMTQYSSGVASQAAGEKHHKLSVQDVLSSASNKEEIITTEPAQNRGLRLPPVAEKSKSSCSCTFGKKRKLIVAMRASRLEARVHSILEVETERRKRRSDSHLMIDGGADFRRSTSLRL